MSHIKNSLLWHLIISHHKQIRVAKLCLEVEKMEGKEEKRNIIFGIFTCLLEESFLFLSLLPNKPEET